MGAHGTRIPFGGDIAGANLEVLLGSTGLNRNETFIVGAYNSLPARGGGEPATAELRAPVGDYSNSIDLLRATVVATGPALIVVLGNIGLRTLAGALSPGGMLPSLARVEKSGAVRGQAMQASSLGETDERFRMDWNRAWGLSALPRILWLMHPSAQNMSPYARRETLFHQRMRDARRDLRRAARACLGVDLPGRRPPLPTDGIYALPVWRDQIAPRIERMDRLWREHGL